MGDTGTGETGQLEVAQTLKQHCVDKGRDSINLAGSVEFSHTLTN